MAKKNSINNETEELTIDPGATGDSFVQFDIDGTEEFRIGVDDTDDSFRISQGSALGANDTFIMTAAGERRMPLNPAFEANTNGDVLNVTGDGTTYTNIYGTERFDQGGDFDGISTFTAPIDGRYCFATNTDVDNLTSAMDGYLTRLVTSNRIYIGVGYSNVVAVPEDKQLRGWAMLCDMDAADTATATIRVDGGGLTADIGGDNINPQTYISGFLAT